MTNSNVIDWPDVPPNPVPKPDFAAWDKPATRDDLIGLYKHSLEWQRQEILRKNYEISALRERLVAYHEELAKVRAGTPHSAFEVLLLLANDPTQPANVRLRAAESIVQLERPKLSATVNTNHNLSIASRLDARAPRLTLVPPSDAVIE